LRAGLLSNTRMTYDLVGIPAEEFKDSHPRSPLHRETPKAMMESLSPMGRPSTVEDITDAVMYLTDAATVTGHILYVDGGSHFGRW
jgi:NAD(P)-dependent dehydrogenase (short-subunit alcohol dehydrogenase family)